MSIYSFPHLSDQTLVEDLAEAVARDRASTATTVALISEFDARRLYLPAGYPSMFVYCVQVLHLSEDSTFKRIRAARAARQFPAIFTALAEGRLHLSAVVLLVPHLSEDTADELLAASAHKTKSEVELMLAQKFPRADVPTQIRALSNVVAGAIGKEISETVSDQQTKLAPGPVSFPVDQHSSSAALDLDTIAPARLVESRRPRPVVPLAPQRFAIQFTVGQSTHDKLRIAQDLVSHEVPTGDVACVIELALDALIASRMKRKYAAVETPRAPRQHSGAEGRYVPAHVRRVVWERDGGRCSFVGETGHRCPARKFLEFDHADPVARGGRATVDSTRLRCRAHNQYEADQTLGAEFMRQKREQAREARQNASS